MNAPVHTLPPAQFNHHALAYSRYLNTMRREAKARALRQAQHFAELLRCGWGESAAMELATLVEAV